MRKVVLVGWARAAERHCIFQRESSRGVFLSSRGGRILSSPGGSISSFSSLPRLFHFLSEACFSFFISGRLFAFLSSGLSALFLQRAFWGVWNEAHCARVHNRPRTLILFGVFADCREQRNSPENVGPRRYYAHDECTRTHFENAVTGARIVNDFLARLWACTSDTLCSRKHAA